MAEVEDYGDFGSHFLDSMLEVEMTEDDAELDVSQTDDPLAGSMRELPPIPTFDLQTETFTYKDIYRNPLTQSSVVQPGQMLSNVLAKIVPSNATSASTANLKVVPPNLYQTIVTKQSPKLNQKPGVTPKIPTPPKSTLSPKPTLALKPTLSSKSTLATKQILTVKTPTPTKPVTAPKVTPAQSPLINPKAIVGKPVGSPKTTLPAAAIKPPAFTKQEITNQLYKTQFLKQVFRPEYVKNVFEKADPPHEISHVGEEEKWYYDKVFQDVWKVAYCRLHCTICDKHLGCSSEVEKKITVHSMLKVLTCKPCYQFYGDGNFPCDDGDNCEIYCRWCGQGGALVCCSFCPRVFCKKCVRRNFGPTFLRSIEKAKDWACFCCAQKPLWPHRAICRALISYLSSKTARKLKKDTSSCCEHVPYTGPGRKRKLRPLERDGALVSNATTITTPNSAAIRINAQPKDRIYVVGSEQNKKLILPPTRLLSSELFKKGITAVKITDQNKSPGPPPLALSSNIRNAIPKLTGITTIPRTNVLRTYNSTSPAAKTMSSLSLPQSIQAPVYHGQTLITPPASRQAMMPSSRVASATSVAAPFLQVSLSTQTSNVDITKIPTAKIPHNVQGLILRMNFPDNKVQLVRLVTEGNGCNAGKGFNMPEFKKSEDMDFLESTLEDSFKLTKLVYDRLILIKDKVNSKTRFTEESVYNSSVKKLHTFFDKTKELLQELDEELTKNHEEWKNQSRSVVDVIDLSDDETKNTPQKLAKFQKSRKFAEKSKVFLRNEDSDIEIIEEDASAGVASLEDVVNNSDQCDKDKSEENNENGIKKSSIDAVKEKYKIKELSIDLVKLPHNTTLTVKKRRKGSRRNCKRIKFDDKKEDRSADQDDVSGESDDGEEEEEDELEKKELENSTVNDEESRDEAYDENTEDEDEVGEPVSATTTKDPTDGAKEEADEKKIDENEEKEEKERTNEDKEDGIADKVESKTGGEEEDEVESRRREGVEHEDEIGEESEDKVENGDEVAEDGVADETENDEEGGEDVTHEEAENEDEGEEDETTEEVENEDDGVVDDIENGTGEGEENDLEEELEEDATENRTGEDDEDEVADEDAEENTTGECENYPMGNGTDEEGTNDGVDENLHGNGAQESEDEATGNEVSREEEEYHMETELSRTEEGEEEGGGMDEMEEDALLNEEDDDDIERPINDLLESSKEDSAAAEEGLENGKA